LETSKKIFIVKPYGGLANRMRVISSLLWLKSKFNAELKVIWLANDELNANYLDLFQIHPDFEVMEELGKYNYIKTSNQKNSIMKRLAKFINNLIGVDYCVYDSDIYKGVDDILEIISHNSVIFFNTCEEIYQFDEGLRSIKIKSELVSRLDNISSNLNFDQDIIGVHIRRTDHNIAIKISPLFLFENILEKEFDENPNTRAYIASDDLEIINHFKENYKNKVVFISKVFGRDTKEGIVDGLIELYLLSKTKKIYGSYWSSYSKVAGRLSGINVETLRLKNE